MQGAERARRGMLRLLVLGGVAAGMLKGAAARPAARRQSEPTARRPTVVVDPGHGGSDPGAISPNGVSEKDIVLATARDFARQLAATRRYRVVLTRSIDEFIPLTSRVARARGWHADLFLSLHANALPQTDMRGLSVFTLSAQASDRQAAALAANENRSDLVGGINLSQQPREIGDVLIDLVRRETDNWSIVLARNILDQFARNVVLLDHPQRSADFMVLTAPDIPSVLIELGCLSNRQEERLLKQRAYRQKLAQGLVRAVEAYFTARIAR